ncbi:uncharacterized protein PRCAT00000416001 [Priceomyces carsonii]|uniref:uncharacterized protein n=1 Tax=Priceomyces carsonii TaxID=28549 RepID=UPI002ED931DF|nr:unnamed protein product [Priceomyces carsonii]
MGTARNPLQTVKSIGSGNVLTDIKSHASMHMSHIASHRSEVRAVDPLHAANEVELLAEIGYKQELRRHYSNLQAFGM